MCYAIGSPGGGPRWGSNEVEPGESVLQVSLSSGSLAFHHR